MRPHTIYLPVSSSVCFPLAHSIMCTPQTTLHKHWDSATIPHMFQWTPTCTYPNDQLWQQWNILLEASSWSFPVPLLVTPQGRGHLGCSLCQLSCVALGSHMTASWRTGWWREGHGHAVWGRHPHTDAWTCRRRENYWIC